MKPNPEQDADRAALSEDEAVGLLVKVFQREWSDWTLDTGCYPDTFSIERGTLSAQFHQSMFGENLARAAYRTLSQAAKADERALQTATNDYKQLLAAFEQVCEVLKEVDKVCVMSLLDPDVLQYNMKLLLPRVRETLAAPFRKTGA